MNRYNVSKSSDVGASEALELTIEAALSLSDNAEKVHILIKKIIETGKMWKVMAEVVIEAKRKQEEEEERKKKKEKEQKLKFEEESKAAYERSLREIREEGFTYMEEDELVHLWMPITLETTYQTMKVKPELAYVHFMPKGVLWEKAQKCFPDMEFYEAAHNELSDEPIKRLEPRFDKEMRSEPETLEFSLAGESGQESTGE